MALVDYNTEITRSQIREILKQQIEMNARSSIMSGYTSTSSTADSTFKNEYYIDDEELKLKVKEIKDNFKFSGESEKVEEETPVFHFDPKELVND